MFVEWKPAANITATGTSAGAGAGAGEEMMSTSSELSSQNKDTADWTVVVNDATTTTSATTAASVSYRPTSTQPSS